MKKKYYIILIFLLIVVDGRNNRNYSSSIVQPKYEGLVKKEDGQYYYVKDIIDGDSFILKNGEEVRLLGCDAPGGEEKGGKEATQFLRSLILNKNVRLLKDVTNKDKYNRLLRYVFINNTFVNAKMIEEGYAVAYIFPPDTLYKELFISLQQKAENNKKGLWKIKGIFQPLKISITREELQSKNVISWKSAHKYYGEIKTVEGIIVTTYNSGKACFLNFHPNWQKYFTAVIFASDFHKFPPAPEVYYLNKKVLVKGLIKKYKGKPQIILKHSSQIIIIDKNFNKHYNFKVEKKR